MALDEALTDSVREGARPVLRFYGWSPACLSLGRNQPAAEHYDRMEIARCGLDVVRRPTGGRAVLHSRELTYSVVVDDRRLGGLRESYQLINRALVAGLRRLGIAAELQPAGDERAAVPSLRPCFEQPAEGEVVVAGRKLVGSAQLRDRGVLLQHGSLLLEDDQSLIERLQRHPHATPTSPPAVLAEQITPLPSWEALTTALAEGWTEVLGGSLQACDPAPGELATAEKLLAKHGSMEWIWRR